MVEKNYCFNCGDNFDYSDGGAVLTIWASFAGLYIYDNDIQNFRYQALVISGHSVDKNFVYLPTGNQNRDVYISGNKFIPGPLTERDTASLSAIDYLRVYDDNIMEGKVNFDSTWNFQQNGLLNIKEELYFKPGGNKYDIRRLGIPLSEQEYNDLIVPY
jgi:hypothetical protein